MEYILVTTTGPLNRSPAYMTTTNGEKVGESELKKIEKALRRFGGVQYFGDIGDEAGVVRSIMLNDRAADLKRVARVLVGLAQSEGWRTRSLYR